MASKKKKRGKEEEEEKEEKCTKMQVFQTEVAFVPGFTNTTITMPHTTTTLLLAAVAVCKFPVFS